MSALPQKADMVRIKRAEAFPVRKSLCYGRSLFPGNAILRGRDNGGEKGGHLQPLVSRYKAPRLEPRRFGPIRTTPGSFRLGLRGGPGRADLTNRRQ